MVYKYYTADLTVFGKHELQAASITIKTWRWENPVRVVEMMKNQLEYWGFDGHRVFNFRRIY